MKRLFVLAAVTLFGCATVRQADLDSWVGQPVSRLETHPLFLTIPVVKTQASDGTEIWNYVNGANVGMCFGGGNINTSMNINYAAYSSFNNCISRFGACNNIFYIKDGYVTRYTPIGSGGVRCYTDETVRPGHSNPTNYR